MKHLFRSLLLTLAFGVAAASAAEPAKTDQDCYQDVCVGDVAVNVTRDYREVTVVGIDNLGKFVLRFHDNGGVGGNWDRADLALMRGCAGDLCVGFPAINVSRDYRRVKVHAIHSNGRLVLRFDDNGGVGGNWDRWDLAVGWGCVAEFCVNDTIYNRKNNRQAKVAAIQTTATGGPSKFVLTFLDNGGTGGNWDTFDLVLLTRGPTAYPPPMPTPYCPPGTHYDPRTNSCVRDLPPPPPPPPYCPPGTHWDPRLGRCVANQPPPPPPPRDWLCQIQKPGRVFQGRGPTRGAATTAVLRSCASAGYACGASEAACRQ